MNNMITKLVENLHKEELISEEDKIIYLFGLKELISYKQTKERKVP